MNHSLGWGFLIFLLAGAIAGFACGNTRTFDFMRSKLSLGLAIGLTLGALLTMACAGRAGCERSCAGGVLCKPLCSVITSAEGSR